MNDDLQAWKDSRKARRGTLPHVESEPVSARYVKPKRESDPNAPVYVLGGAIITLLVMIIGVLAVWEIRAAKAERDAQDAMRRIEREGEEAKRIIQRAINGQ